LIKPIKFNLLTITDFSVINISKSSGLHNRVKGVEGNVKLKFEGRARD
jgi:hypothetical protein